MDHQQLAGSSVFAFIHGQLSLVLAGCQQLPSGWQQQQEFTALLQRAFNMLHDASATTIPAHTDTGVNTSNDQGTKQCQPSSDQDKRRQLHQQKLKQQNLYTSLNTTDTAAEDYAAAIDGAAEQVGVLGSSSSSTAAQLQALQNLAAAVEEEYAEVQEAETPVRAAVCAAGGLNHLLRLITSADHSNNATISSSSSSGSSSSSSGSSSSGSSSSMEVAIVASRLLLAVTECRGGSHRYCNNWAHRYIEPAAVPALVRLLLFHDAIAKRAAELLASLARDTGRHADIAAAGGIAGLLHVLSDEVLAGNAAEMLAGKGPALSRPYAVLAVAAAALEALIVDGPEDAQIAVAEAGGVAVLERICEHLVRQKLSRRQPLGAVEQQQRGMCHSCTVRAE